MLAQVALSNQARCRLLVPSSVLSCRTKWNLAREYCLKVVSFYCYYKTSGASTYHVGSAAAS